MIQFLNLNLKNIFTNGKNMKRILTRLQSSSRNDITRSVVDYTSFLSPYCRYFYNDIYKVVLPEKHRFPMNKYRLVRDELTNDLKKEGLLDPMKNVVEFVESPLATVDEITSTHCPNYVSRFFQGQLTDKENRVVGFPWSQAGVARCASSVGGTLAATRSVCSDESQVAAHLAGGTHHAFYDRGEGFCVFSDIAVAANLALEEFPDIIKQILIIDLDVHQGNGNAVLFEDDERVFTFSAHCSGNFFSEIRQSDVDVELVPGTSDGEYLSVLARWIPWLMDKVKPDLVFYQAGVDGIANDRLGKLKLSQAGLIARNRMVYDAVRQTSSKLVVTMGGGYPTDLNPDSDSYKQIIRAHTNVYKDMLYM